MTGIFTIQQQALLLRHNGCYCPAITGVIASGVFGRLLHLLEPHIFTFILGKYLASGNALGTRIDDRNPGRSLRRCFRTLCPSREIATGMERSLHLPHRMLHLSHKASHRDYEGDKPNQEQEQKGLQHAIFPCEDCLGMTR